jgi:radical SAM superfamily enzyme
MIYFIQSGAVVKIGFCARDPIRRLEKLQIGNPIKLHLIALMVGGPIEEQQWHSRFAKVRERGEWFRLTPGLLSAIKPHMVDHDEVSAGRPARKIEGIPAHWVDAFVEQIATYEEPAHAHRG